MLIEILKNLKGQNYEDGLRYLKGQFGALKETSYTEGQLCDLYANPFNNDEVNGFDAWICYTTKFIIHDDGSQEAVIDGGYWSILDAGNHIVESHV